MVTSAGTLGLDSRCQDFGPALTTLRVRGYEVQPGQRAPNIETTVDTQGSVLPFVEAVWPRLGNFHLGTEFNMGS